MSTNCDVCIIGGGSAGIGAAYRAARAGAKVILVEKMDALGGTAVNAWVSSWEPGAGSSGLAKTIWQTMLPRHPNLPDYPYEATLWSLPHPDRYPLAWPSDLYLWAVEKLFRPLTGLQVLTDTVFVAVDGDSSRIGELVLLRDGEEIRLRPQVTIDATADGNVCVAADCPYKIGEDAQADYNEPHAPKDPQRRVNAIDLIYCVHHVGEETDFRLPDDVEPGSCDRGAHIHECPAGLRYVNPCGMMSGIRWLDEDRGALMAEARRNVWAHFDYLRRSDPYYRQCRLEGVAPQMGVRETRRIFCEHMLTERDILAGWDHQSHPDLIAMSDHELDIHGEGGLGQHLKTPYGIPFRCLIPRGWENLLVAGRCAGFTHIAASSCRLSRTMMALGEAAGLAGALMGDRRCTSRDLPAGWWRDQLIIDDRRDFQSVQ